MAAQENSPAAAPPRALFDLPCLLPILCPVRFVSKTLHAFASQVESRLRFQPSSCERRRALARWIIRPARSHSCYIGLVVLR